MFKVLFAKQKKLPWKPKKDRGAKPCLSRFPRELRVRCFARDARTIRPSARLLFPIATPHRGRDGCWAIHLYVFHCTPFRQLKQYQFSRRRRSEPIYAHLWAEIGSKNLLPAPRTHQRGKKTYAKDCGVCSSLFQLRFSNWNRIFPCLPGIMVVCSNCSSFQQVLYI